MSEEPNINELGRRMDGALESLRHDFAGLRSGRATTTMLEPVTVDVYGSNMPLNQIGTVTVPEPRLLSVQVWDKSNVSAVEKAIRDSGLGLNPMVDGQLVRIPIPELNEERRRELSKVAGQYAEQARIAVRNVRRDGMDSVKKASGMSEDEQKMWTDEIQSLTDQHIEKIDDMLDAKEKEIMQV